MAETHLWRLIDAWRRRQKWPPNQAQLAREIGVERSAVSQWKLGQAVPSPAHLRAIQSATGIRYRDLLDALLADQGYLAESGVAQEKEAVRDGASSQAEAQNARAGVSPADKENPVEGRSESVDAPVPSLRRASGRRVKPRTPAKGRR